MKKPSSEVGKKVKPNFEYSSNKNPHFLSLKEIKKYLSIMKIKVIGEKQAFSNNRVDKIEQKKIFEVLITKNCMRFY